MGAKHPNPNLVKIHLPYSVDETARLLKLSKGTVRRWLKTGLEALDGPGLTLVRGSVLRVFLRERRAKAKCPCGPGFLYCLRCHTPRQPASGKADLVCDRGRNPASRIRSLRGICPDCSLMMYRRVNLDRLESVRGNLEITLEDGQPRLEGTPLPSLNDDLRQDAQP